MNQKRMSVLSGLLYLSLVFFGPIALLILPSQFDVVDINLFAKDNIGLLLLWILVDLIIIGIEIMLSIYLYRLFKTYSIKLSTYAFIFRLAVVLVMVVNTTFLVITLANNGSNADNYIPLHQTGTYIWQLCFSVHVFLLGLIVVKHNPSLWRYLGMVLLIGSFGYLVDAIIALGNIDNPILNIMSGMLLIFITIGEIGTSIGLLMNKIVMTSLIVRSHEK